MFTQLLSTINSFVWGPVTIILLVGTGIFTTLLLKGVQVKKFFLGMGLLSGKYDDPNDRGEITHFQALSAALSATIGTGNIAAVAQAIRFGVARGVFSNEAGLGSAPIAHGAARTEEPVREGLVAMLGPFIDTIVICTMTALVIIISGAWQEGLSGSDLTARAFNMGLPVVGGYIVAIGIIFFAFSTAVSWSYYGDRSVEYLFGTSFVMPYRILYCFLLPVGAAVELNLVWTISDIFNALMARPNLIGLLFLSGVVTKTTKDYFKGSAQI